MLGLKTYIILPKKRHKRMGFLFIALLFCSNRLNDLQKSNIKIKQNIHTHTHVYTKHQTIVKHEWFKETKIVTLKFNVQDHGLIHINQLRISSEKHH